MPAIAQLLALRLFLILAVTVATRPVVGAVPAPPVLSPAVVNGNAVTLSWSVPFGAIAIRLEAGSAPGLSNAASSVVGLVSNYTATGVPPGVYYLRVRAIDSSGESAPSNEITIAVGPTVPPACSAPPNQPTLGSPVVTGNSVSFAWTPAAVGCPATSFTLHAGSAPGLSNVAIVSAGAAQGLGASAPNGVYYVRVLAQNAYGSSAPSNEMSAMVGVLGPATPSPETYTGMVSTTSPGCTTNFGTLPCAVVSLTATTNSLDAILQWPSADVDLDLFLYQGSTRLGISNAELGTQERITATVQPGQSYELRIAHWGNVYRSAAGQAYTLSVARGSALPAPPPPSPPPTPNPPPIPNPPPAPSGYRVGARCRDNTTSTATGSGACSHHGGVACWRYNDGTCRAQ
jgi:hypothetical protein